MDELARAASSSDGGCLEPSRPQWSSSGGPGRNQSADSWPMLLERTARPPRPRARRRSVPDDEARDTGMRWLQTISGGALLGTGARRALDQPLVRQRWRGSVIIGIRSARATAEATSLGL